VRVSLPKLFRHNAKLATARIGDFERPMTPFIARAVRAVMRAAMQQTTERPARAAPVPVSYQAEVAAIQASFAIKLDDLRRRLPPAELGAAIRALRAWKASELRAIRERRALKRDGDRHAREEQLRAKPSSYEPTH
jgi:hypothetical protein